MTAALVCQGVSVAYDARRPGRRALDGVSFTAARGEVVAVVGESGSGKSTLGRALLGLVRRAEGEVSVLGVPVPADPRLFPAGLRARIQPVFQDPGAALDPMRTVAEAIEEPMLLRTRLKPDERAARASELLQQVGLVPAHLGRWPHELSGGQKQRVCIARALAAEP